MTKRDKISELKKLIAELGVSQREAARRLEVDDRTIRYWLSGNPPPPIAAIFALRYLVSIQ